MNRKFVGIAFAAMVLASNGCSAGIFSSKSEEQKEAEKKNQDELEKLYAKLKKESADFTELMNKYNYQNWEAVQFSALASFRNLEAAFFAIDAIIKMSGKTPEKVNGALRFIKDSLDDDLALRKSTHQKRKLDEAVKELETHKANMKALPLGIDKPGTKKVKEAIRVFLAGVEKVYKEMLNAEKLLEKENKDLKKLYAKLEKYSADFTKLTNKYNYQNWEAVQSPALGYSWELNEAVSAINAIIKMSGETPKKVKGALVFIRNSIDIDFTWIKSTHQKRRLEDAVKELETHKANMKSLPLGIDNEGTKKVKEAIRVFLVGLEKFYNKRLDAFKIDLLYGMPN